MPLISTNLPFTQVLYWLPFYTIQAINCTITLLVNIQYYAINHTVSRLSTTHNYPISSSTTNWLLLASH